MRPRAREGGNINDLSPEVAAHAAVFASVTVLAHQAMLQTVGLIGGVRAERHQDRFSTTNTTTYLRYGQHGPYTGLDELPS